MKRPLLATLLLAPLLSLGQTFYYIDQITVSPAAPTSSDPITITLIGNLSASNSYIINTSYSIVGNQVNITVNAGSSGIGLPVLTPHNEVFNIGMLSAGTYTIVINGTSTLDSAPTPQHQFVVSGGGSPCDSVIVDYVQWAPFSDTALVVHVYNTNTMTFFSYPGWILYNSLGDTLAKEVVNFFGIAGESWHTLSIHPGAVIPSGTFSGTLELWTGFYTTLECTFSWTGDLCPPACVELYPNISPTSSTPVIGSFPWTIADDLGSTVASGVFQLSGGSPTDADTACLLPGVYTLTIQAPTAPDSSLWFWVNSGDWYISTPTVYCSQDGLPDELEFVYYEQCIDSANSIAEADRADWSVWSDDAAIHVLALRGKLGAVEILSSDGRLVERLVVAGSELILPTRSFAPGIYIVRSSALATAARALVR